MPSRFAMPLTIALVFLLIVVGVAWRPSSKPVAEMPMTLEYTSPRGYVAPRAGTTIVIDGKLDDAGWTAAPWSEEFIDIEGDIKPKPRFRTRMKMTWDDDALYIAAELQEPHVWGKLTQHDAVVFHDNDFEVFLDPDDDTHMYGEVELNALNTTWDLLLSKPYRAGGKAVDDWEIAGLKTAVHVDGTLNDPHDEDRGWTLEIAWPWPNLKQIGAPRSPPRVGDQWRINFSRVEWDIDIVDGKYRKIAKRPEHNWVWSPQHAIDMHRPEHWGYLQFGGSHGKDMTFRPDATGPARVLLQRIHDAQRDYRVNHDRYAESLAALGLTGLTHESITGAPRLEATTNGYEASVKVRDGPRVRIRDDNRVTLEE